MRENNSYTGLNQLLKILSDNQIDFVVIGGFACVVYGTSLVTRDLDVCAVLTPETIQKLRQILAPYHPKHRMTSQKLSFLEEPRSLSGVNNLYLDTDLGMIDFLSDVKGLGGLQRLKEKAETVQLFSRSVRVLSLEDLILSKEQLSRPKDKAAVYELKEMRSRIGVVGTADNMRAVYEKFAKHGSNAESLGSASEFKAVKERILNFFESLPRGSHILDVGPGRGDEALLAVSLGHSVTGLDFSPSMQALFKRNVPAAQTVLSEMTDIPAEFSGAFDVVFSSFSFLHLPRERGIKALSEFRKVLKVPGGRLFLSTFVGSGQDELNSGRDFLKQAGIASWYFYHWDLSDLLERVREAGFRIESHELFQLVPDRPDLTAIRAAAV